MDLLYWQSFFFWGGGKGEGAGEKIPDKLYLHDLDENDGGGDNVTKTANNHSQKMVQ